MNTMTDRMPYSLQFSRYLRQLPWPCSPNSSLWRHARRNSPLPAPVVAYAQPPGPISIPGTWIPCETLEAGKAKRATTGECIRAHEKPLYVPSHQLGGT
jgi:hypothetical protein